MRRGVKGDSDKPEALKAAAGPSGLVQPSQAAVPGLAGARGCGAAHNPLAGDAPTAGPLGWVEAARLGKAVSSPSLGHPRLPQARSLRRVHSELSVAPAKDKHDAPEKASGGSPVGRPYPRRASFFEPLLVRADLLSCTAQSVRGCLSTSMGRRHDRPRQTASSQRPINAGLACVP